MQNDGDHLLPDHFQSERGLFGAFGVADAARAVVLGLHGLQHRGEGGAGVFASDGDELRAHSGRGLVGRIFDGAAVAGLRGAAALGQVQQPPLDSSGTDGPGPLKVRYRDGQVVIAQDGTLFNGAGLREQLEVEGAVFTSDSDTELVLHLVARSTQTTFVNRVVDALYQLEGAYALALLTRDRLVAVRDPRGFRPLSLGRLGDGWVVASESCAIERVGGQDVREVAPGEMVIVDGEGLVSLRPFPRRSRRACIFEHVGLARSDSHVFGRDTYALRLALGRRLAQEHPAMADVVIPVPDTGVAGAIGYAAQSGLPYQRGLLRLRCAGPGLLEGISAEQALRLEHSPVQAVVRGARVVVVDDAVAGGASTRGVVAALRAAGAVQVHLRVTSPPITGRCPYGNRGPRVASLVAHGAATEQVRRALGVDTLGYLSIEGLQAAEGEQAGSFCDACFSGDYPVDPTPRERAAQMSLFVQDG